MLKNKKSFREITLFYRGHSAIDGAFCYIVECPVGILLWGQQSTMRHRHFMCRSVSNCCLNTLVQQNGRIYEQLKCYSIFLELFFFRDIQYFFRDIKFLKHAKRIRMRITWKHGMLLFRLILQGDNTTKNCVLILLKPQLTFHQL